MSTQVAIVLSVALVCITISLTAIITKGMDYALEKKEHSVKTTNK
jgi:hypothetical protein